MNNAGNSKVLPDSLRRVVDDFRMRIDQYKRTQVPSREGPAEVFGVFGRPVSFSLSPLMHNRAFTFSGYNGIYLPFEVDDIAAAIAAVRHLNIKGVSVTLPHKVRVMELLDALDAPAKAIGAVNTVTNRQGVLTGTNSDGIGALQALSEHVSIPGKQIVIIGAGGAAKAIGYTLRQAGGRITLVNRTIKKGEHSAAALNASFSPLSDIAMVPCDIMINATPLGMTPDRNALPVPPAVLKKGMTVMDIVYTPLNTLLLKKARAAGCHIIDGLSMFVYQGAFQFEQWTKLEAPVNVMRTAVLKALKTMEQKNK